MGILVPSPLDAFLFSAIVIVIAQASRYCVVRVRNDQLRDWIALLGRLRARDFTGSKNFYLGIVGLSVANITIFYLICLIPPTVLKGFFTAVPQLKPTSELLDKTPAPILIALLYLGFMGLDPSFNRVLTRYSDWLIDFFQDRIDVPYEVVSTSQEISETLYSQIGQNKEKIKDEIERILERDFVRAKAGARASQKTINPTFEANLKDCIDRQYFDERVRKLFDAIQEPVEYLSKQELLNLIRQTIMLLMIAGARRKGSDGIRSIRDALVSTKKVTESVQKIRIPGLIVYAIVFIIVMYLLYLTIGLLDGPVGNLISGKALGAGDLWDGFLDKDGLGPQRVCINVLTVMAPYIVTIFIALLYENTDAREPPRGTNILSFVDNSIRYGAVFVICIMANFLSIWLVNFINYVINTPPQIERWYFIRNSAVFLIKSIIPIGLAYVILYAREAEKFRGIVAPLSGELGLLVACGAAAVLSLLSSAIFINVSPNKYPYQTYGYAIEFYALGLLLNVAGAAIAFLAIRFAFARHGGGHTQAHHPIAMH